MIPSGGVSIAIGILRDTCQAEESKWEVKIDVSSASAMWTTSTWEAQPSNLPTITRHSSTDHHAQTHLTHLRAQLPPAALRRVGAIRKLLPGRRIPFPRPEPVWWWTAAAGASEREEP